MLFLSSHFQFLFIFCLLSVYIEENHIYFCTRVPGCGRDWCLMCELEQHVMMLRESGEPLSPNRFLLRMQSINSQIGNGSQEDAHEFLRFTWLKSSFSLQIIACFLCQIYTYIIHASLFWHFYKQIQFFHRKDCL